MAVVGLDPVGKAQRSPQWPSPGGLAWLLSQGSDLLVDLQLLVSANDRYLGCS